MAKNFSNNKAAARHRAGEVGQSTVFFVLALGIFLLGALALAFDFSNMWFHRQAAQTAADAACAAGAMDLLVDAQGGATGHQGFTLGTAYSCTSSSTDSVCSYAAKNGYNSNGSSPGNAVNVSFPSSVIGVTKPPGPRLRHLWRATGFSSDSLGRARPALRRQQHAEHSRHPNDQHLWRTAAQHRSQLAQHLGRQYRRQCEY